MTDAQAYDEIIALLSDLPCINTRKEYDTVVKIQKYITTLYSRNKYLVDAFVTTEPDSE